jgi:hypothetical protein
MGNDLSPSVRSSWTTDGLKVLMHDTNLPREICEMIVAYGDFCPSCQHAMVVLARCKHKVYTKWGCTQCTHRRNDVYLCKECCGECQCGYC